MSFFATLGVSADKRHPFVLRPFSNITTLSEPFNSTTVFGPAITEVRNFTCRTGNDTHAHYSSATFNATKVNSSFFGWAAMNASCQADFANDHRMVTAQCVPSLNEDECHHDAPQRVFNLSQILTSLKRNSRKRVRKLWNVDTFETIVWSEEYNFANTSGSFYAPNDIIGTDGRTFVYGVEGERQVFNGTVLYFFRNSSTNSWYFSVGIRTRNTKSHNGIFQSREPLRLTFYGTSSIEFLFASCRQHTLLIDYMIDYGIDNWVAAPTIDIFDRFLVLALGGVQLPPSTLAYVKMPPKDVTILDRAAIILYSTVVILAILIFPTRELLFFFLVRSGKATQSELFAYEYDQMSKNYRADHERMSDKASSGEYTILKATSLDSKSMKQSQAAAYQVNNPQPNDAV